MDTLILPSDVGVDVGGDLDHLTCCVDEDISLCGLDVSGMAIDESIDVPNCIVCSDLAANPTFCPKYAKCTEY